MDHYDPEIAPAPQEWLALDEGERVLRARHLHATIYVIVENQLALDDQTIVRSTLDRLMDDGLTRHEAIHAIGSVLAEHIYDLLHTESAAPDPLAPYYAALQQLTAEKWRDG
ncbi:MAG: hypothetical protein HYS65_16535 [Betaproteobacteria bacterium]|nr:hypothetical protein [Betaproteobacteria bacterium]